MINVEHTLAKIRKLAEIGVAWPADCAAGTYFGELSRRLHDLDAELSDGGPLPADWVPAAGRDVTDVQPGAAAVL